MLEEARRGPRSRKLPQKGARRSQEATCSTQMAQITMSSRVSSDREQKEPRPTAPVATRRRKEATPDCRTQHEVEERRWTMGDDTQRTESERAEEKL